MLPSQKTRNWAQGGKSYSYCLGAYLLLTQTREQWPLDLVELWNLPGSLP